MQKKFKLITLAIASFLVVGCDNSNSHVHKYSDEWSYNASGHFHKCTVEGCDKTSEIVAHSFDEDNICTVCGYTAVVEGCEHTWGEWEVTEDPTCQEPGEKIRECTKCGKVDTLAIEPDTVNGHSYGPWSTTKNATDTEEGEEVRTCSRCQNQDKRSIPVTSHTHTFDTSRWEKNATNHWHPATCGHDVKDAEAAHTFGSWSTSRDPGETSTGLKQRACTVCGYVEVETIPALGPSNTAFTITTDLTSVKEIHTTEQKTYLSYSGNYATIDANKYPDGQNHLSDSLPVDLAWTFTPESGKTVKKYSVTFGQQSDLSDGYEVVGTTTPSIKIYNVFLGTNYFKITAEYTDGSKVSSGIKTFKVDETAPRNLTIEGMTNCRDMGGRVTEAGGKVKQGLIYRTSGKNQNGSLTSKTTEEMVNHLGVKNEINIADSSSYNLSLSGTTVYDANMDYGGSAKHHFSRNAESLKNVFKLLSDENNYPIYYHCRIGTDRTGLVGNMVYGLLGVSLNMIYQDYLFSNFGKIGEKRYIGSAAGQDDISVYMEEVNSMPGATYQEKCYNALLSIGIPSTTLDKVINILTDGAKPNDAKGQMAVNAGNMSVTSGSITHTSRAKITDHQEPEYYIKLSSNVTASYTFKTTEAGTAKIYGYLGHNDNDTKTISDSVSVYIDDAAVTVPSTTFKDAGMGHCGGSGGFSWGGGGSSGRTNYYFVNLGEKANLAAGNHTIKIVGKANDMKLGTLSIFGVAGVANLVDNTGGNSGSGSGNSGSQGNENQGGNTQVDGEYVTTFESKKFGKGTGETLTANVEAGTYRLDVSCKMSDYSHGKYHFYAEKALGGDDVEKAGTYEGEYRYTVKVDGKEVPMTNTKTYSENGIGTSSHTYVTFVASIELTAGEHTVSVIRHNQLGFSLYMDAIKLVKIGGTQGGNSGSGNENQGGNSGSQGNENQGGNTQEPVTYTYNFTADKFDKGEGRTMTQIVEAGTYRLDVDCKMSNDHRTHRFYAEKSVGGDDVEKAGTYEGEYRYIVAVDGGEVPMTNIKTYGDNGLSTTSYKFVEFVASIELTAGEHTISVTRHNALGFSVYMDAFKLVKIA